MLRNTERSPAAADRELVDRMRSGDPAAFDELAETHLPALYRFASRRLDGDRELVKDIVQSTLCKVIEKLDGYRAEAPLLTWMCACCQNEIALHFRRLGRRPHEVELDESREPRPLAGEAGWVAVGPETQLLEVESAELVHLALDRMPPAYARAVEWRYLEELEVGEIARRLDSSYKAAESLLSRARKAFREAYSGLASVAEPAS
jgi:RNA polymerase sigma-70 factor (ECF subfamily)